MAQWRIFFGQEKSDDGLLIHGNQGFRARLRQKMPEHHFRISNSGWKAFLIQLQKSRKILGIGLADGDAHGPDSRLDPFFGVSDLLTTKGLFLGVHFCYALAAAACRSKWFTFLVEAPVRTEIIRRDESASASSV